ncbi:hypothetical protein RN03_3319 [Mycobacterium tuberculosis]|nr:hypothetical protein RN03_3319 [Mycobacterium tuberculosis]
MNVSSESAHAKSFNRAHQNIPNVVRPEKIIKASRRWPNSTPAPSGETKIAKAHPTQNTAKRQIFLEIPTPHLFDANRPKSTTRLPINEKTRRLGRKPYFLGVRFLPIQRPKPVLLARPRGAVFIDAFPSSPAPPGIGRRCPERRVGHPHRDARRSGKTEHVGTLKPESGTLVGSPLPSCYEALLRPRTYHPIRNPGKVRKTCPFAIPN